MDELPTVPPKIGKHGDRSQDRREADTLLPTESIHLGPKTTRFSQEDVRSDESLSGAERLQSFRDAREVGRWQFGRILEAKHPRLKRPVRIVVLDAPHSSDAQVREGFLARVRQISLLEHPHVESQVWEAVEDGETVFVVLESSRTKPVTQFLPRTKDQQDREWFYPNQELAQRMLDVASGLLEIRECGIQPGKVTADRIRVDAETGRTLLRDLVPAECGVPEPTFSTQDQRTVKDLCLSFAEIATGLSRDHLEHVSPDEFEDQLQASNHELTSDLRALMTNAVDPEEANETEDDHVDAMVQLIGVLEPMANRVTRELPLTDRIGSLVYNAIIIGVMAVFAFGLVLMATSPRSRSSEVNYVIVAFFLFVVAQPAELVFGRAVGRLVRGYRLLDRTGAKPVFRHRLGRCLVRLLVIMILGGVVELVLRWIGPKPVVDLVLEFPLLVTVILGAVGLYATSFFLPLRKPLHDHLTGTTIATINTTKASDSKAGAGNELPASDGRSDGGEPNLADAGDRLDQFAILGEIGRGGMGTVFVARDMTLDRMVAIKTIAPQFAQGADELQRFEQEARLAAQLSHENVAKVFGVGGGTSSPYLVMEYIEGESLQQLVRQRGALSIRDAWDYVRQAARGLREAGKLGIIHRDIKPANLMVESQTGLLKVMDFGLSKLTIDKPDEQVEGDHPTIDESLVGADLTTVGSVLGTPMYMSPEQASAKKLDARSDIYSLGMTLYFLLSGKTPFDPGTSLDLIIKQCSETPSTLRGQVPQLTKDQLFVLDRMIAKDPADRYPDYTALLADLSDSAPKPPKLAARSKRLLALILTTGVITVLGFGMLEPLVLLGLARWNEPFNGEVSPSMLNWLCSLIVMGLVYVWPLWKWGQTPGKWIMRIRVVRMDGRPLKLWQAVVRTFTFNSGYLIAGVAWLLVRVFGPSDAIVQLQLYLPAAWLVISGLMILFFASRRGIHDFAAGTQVVDVKPRVSRRRQTNTTST